jgi:uncharacterized protein YejL (UPF0352 family)
MLRTIGRQTTTYCDEELAAMITLFVAIIKQASKDASLPVRGRDSTNTNFPSAAEKESAAQFLESLRQSACRRTES